MNGFARMGEYIWSGGRVDSVGWVGRFQTFQASVREDDTRWQARPPHLLNKTVCAAACAQWGPTCGIYLPHRQSKALKTPVLALGIDQCFLDILELLYLKWASNKRLFLIKSLSACRSQLSGRRNSHHSTCRLILINTSLYVFLKVVLDCFTFSHYTIGLRIHIIQYFSLKRKYRLQKFGCRQIPTHKVSVRRCQRFFFPFFFTQILSFISIYSGC